MTLSLAASLVLSNACARSPPYEITPATDLSALLSTAEHFEGDLTKTYLAPKSYQKRFVGMTALDSEILLLLSLHQDPTSADDFYLVITFADALRNGSQRDQYSIKSDPFLSFNLEEIARRASTIPSVKNLTIGGSGYHISIKASQNMKFSDKFLVNIPLLLYKKGEPNWEQEQRLTNHVYLVLPLQVNKNHTEKYLIYEVNLDQQNGEIGFRGAGNGEITTGRYYSMRKPR